MDFLTARLQQKQQIRNMLLNPQAYRNPQPEQDMNKPPEPEVKVKKSREPKKEFIVADDKEEIISDIISQKPKIQDLRKALQEYATISQDENDELN